VLTTKDLAAPYRPTRRAVMATLLIVVFSAGMIAGAVGVRALEDPLARALRSTSPAAMVPFKGVSDNDMSDAARSTLYETRWFRGVAEHNMTDAARAAAVAGSSFKGAADNNMSDAAWRATRGPAR
jgi:hypothetical protein